MLYQSCPCIVAKNEGLGTKLQTKQGFGEAQDVGEGHPGEQDLTEDQGAV